MKSKESRSWFKAYRSDDALELIRTNHHAFVLASIIAIRARWNTAGFFRHNLKPGEALLGDYESYGMTEREYRTAKDNLSKWRFATFKTTNKGTVGSLIDTRLFSVLNDKGDEQGDGRPTGKRQASDGRPTTNIEGYRKKEGVERLASLSPPTSSSGGKASE
jgi:hypothetical protein